MLTSLQKRKTDAGGRTLIFCNSVHSCKDVFTRLQQKGYSVSLLHSDLDVKRRKRGFEEFMQGDTRILVATDLASRGLDLGSRVQHVILYEFPTNTIDYLHRIGRTARAGQPGFVTALVGRKEQRLATLIKQTLEEGRSLAEITPTIPEDKKKARLRFDDVSLCFGVLMASLLCFNRRKRSRRLLRSTKRSTRSPLSPQQRTRPPQRAQLRVSLGWRTTNITTQTIPIDLVRSRGHHWRKPEL